MLDETRREDFEFLTGRQVPVEEIAGSGTVRVHYENDGSARSLACTALDYRDAEIRSKLDARYPPENSPLIKGLLDLAVHVANRVLDT